MPVITFGTERGGTPVGDQKSLMEIQQRLQKQKESEWKAKLKMQQEQQKSKANNANRY